MSINNQYFEICKSIRYDILNQLETCNLDKNEIKELIKEMPEHNITIDFIKTFIVSYYYKAILAFHNAFYSPQEYNCLYDNLTNLLTIISSQLYINYKNTEHIFWYIYTFSKDDYQNRDSELELSENVYDISYSDSKIKKLLLYLPKNYSNYVSKYAGEVGTKFSKHQTNKRSIESNNKDIYRREAIRIQLKTRSNFQKNMNKLTQNVNENTIMAIENQQLAAIMSDFIEYESYKCVERYFHHCSIPKYDIDESTFVYTYIVQKIEKNNLNDVRQIPSSVDFLKFFVLIYGVLEFQGKDELSNSSNFEQIFIEMATLHKNILDNSENNNTVLDVHKHLNDFVEQFPQHIQSIDKEILDSIRLNEPIFEDNDYSFSIEDVEQFTLVVTKTIIHIMYHVSLFNVLISFFKYEFGRLEDYMFDLYYNDEQNSSTIHFLCKYDCIYHCMSSVAEIVPKLSKSSTELLVRLFYDFPVALYNSTCKKELENKLSLKIDIPEKHMKTMLKASFGVIYDIKQGSIIQEEEIITDTLDVLLNIIEDIKIDSIFKVIDSIYPPMNYMDISIKENKKMFTRNEESKRLYIQKFHESLSDTIINDIFEDETCINKLPILINIQSNKYLKNREEFPKYIFLTYSQIIEKITLHLLNDINSTTSKVLYPQDINNTMTEIGKEIGKSLFDMISSLRLRVFQQACKITNIDSDDIESKINILEKFVIPFNFFKLVLNYQKEPLQMYPQPNLYQRVLDLCIT